MGSNSRIKPKRHIVAAQAALNRAYATACGVKSGAAWGVYEGAREMATVLGYEVTRSNGVHTLTPKTTEDETC